MVISGKINDTYNVHGFVTIPQLTLYSLDLKLIVLALYHPPLFFLHTFFLFPPKKNQRSFCSLFRSIVSSSFCWIRERYCACSSLSSLVLFSYPSFLLPFSHCSLLFIPLPSFFYFYFFTLDMGAD